ncbi:hypothetical protein PVAP13_7KG114300 [Panicum virgatum]|uniref:Uncharacterized protein n=1 Tax=Panicum virgatum TaxID=38727 RepID=A0A8T0QEL2_PANVG|nr:hypothetical protein PVAP13_7KG114300 [Panicum virgatum]
MPPANTTQTNTTKSAMDFGFYKRATGIKHKAAAPFYPRKPAQVAQQLAGVRAQQPATPTVCSAQPPPPSTVVTVEVVGNGGAALGGSDTDVDRRAALYISRVQERLRRERMTDDWRKCY